MVFVGIKSSIGLASKGSASSPIMDQFFIHPILYLYMGNYYFSFTNLYLSTLLTLSSVLLVFVVTKKWRGRVVSVPNVW